MRLVPALMLAAAPAAAVEGPCVDGARWVGTLDPAPAAWHERCDAPGEATMLVACVEGAVRITLQTAMPRTEAGAPVALDLAIDGGIYTLAGRALPDSDGGVIPVMAPSDAALDALMMGDRVSVAVPDGLLDLHLVGSAEALGPVRDACTP